ncbi:MAG: HD domain-containing protein [Spirochaetales bacterium]|nr:HD domain-containing protein [Spirochaetales bacterium]
MTDNKEYQNQNKELLFAFRFLAEAIDARDPHTLGHMNRVARFSMKILDQSPWKHDDDLRERLLIAALLHDVGNLKIPEYILKKPGSMSIPEKMEIELHPVYGLTMLGKGILAERVGPIIRAHHERLDGTGYPDGLPKDDIPPAARIIHVADIFDACTSPRIYRPKNRVFNDREAIKLLVESANKGKTDKDIVHAFIKAYNNCDIMMAKAASYSDIKNPLLHRTQGNDHSPFHSAEKHLLKALTLVEKMEENPQLRDPDFWIQKRYKILIRIATIANLTGNPAKALSYCKKANIYTPEESQVDHISLQQAIAYYNCGQRKKALDLANVLKNKKKEDWFKATLFHLLAEHSLITGHLKDAEIYEIKALKCISRMKDKLGKDSLLSPLGVLLRWWNPDRVNWLEGLVKLTCTKRHCYMGYEFTIELAKVTAHQFELTGNMEQRSQARTELGRFLSNAGEFDKAIPILQREYQFAALIGEHRIAMKRAVWLSETFMRQAVCTENNQEKEELIKKAHEPLDSYLTLFGKEKLYKKDKPYIDIGVILTLWYEKNYNPLTARLPGLIKSIKQSNTIYFLEAIVFCQFLLLACKKDSSLEDFLDLTEFAMGYNITIRELEIYAEMIRRFPRVPEEISNRIQLLLGRMGEKCWLLSHPLYKELLKKT